MATSTRHQQPIRAQPTPQTAGELTLADLPPGAWGTVVGVLDSAPAAERLRDLGFLPNTRVRVMRRAPLGDPSIYELRGYRLCLRRTEAARIRVEPLAPR